MNQRNIFYSIELVNGVRRVMLGTLAVIYFLSIGLTIAQIGLLMAVGQLVLVIFEFPTGAFADYFGRKKSVLISFFLFSAAYLLIFLTNNYYFLLLFYSLAIFGWTMQSGTAVAWGVDTLGIKNNEKDRTNVFSKRHIFGNVGWVLGGVFAAGIAYYYLRGFWLFLAAIHFVCFFVLLFRMQEDIVYSRTLKLKETFFGIFKNSKTAIERSIKHTALLMILVVTFLFGMPFKLFELGWPIVFKEILLIPTHYFGLITAGATFFAISGVYIGNRISNKNLALTFIVFYLLFVLSLLLLGLANLVFVGIAGFIFFYLAQAGLYPSAQSVMHRFIPSKQRASILSFRSMVSGMGTGVGAVFAGFLIGWIGVQNAILIGILFFLVMVVLHLKVLKIKK